MVKFINNKNLKQHQKLHFQFMVILKKAVLLISSALIILQLQAQVIKKDSTQNNPYQASIEKINNLVHTKLDVKFDYKKRYLYGKEWVTLTPYAYPTDSLTLDAKGMDFAKVSLIADGKLNNLKYKYENNQLKINLGKSFPAGVNYKIYLEYTAKPNELDVKGSAAINDAKGLYFINPDSTEKDKPVQIWTQGETESSSAWFPTIDKPNQKTTSEISMTVPAKYVSLSNGKLISQKNNSNGTRTDTWKMDLPHAPYLFMMAVGNFKIYKDKWQDKEVNYYLEPAYAPYAKEIFGSTPAMMTFYSKILGVNYPWNKYSQVAVRDFVSGAMENTTATLHGDIVHITPREMLDELYTDAESVIAHELFHQWFGDYVTTESWSNLTVNESFANFSETLWAEQKFGQDAADEHNFKQMQEYLGDPSNTQKNLVRFNYHDKEDMFDAVSYQKGGRILKMLRNYLTKEVFYKGLNIYLKQNAFKNGEAHQLRLAMEEASGKDLNWFFNQWYFGAGHPVLDISYKWDDAAKTQYVYVNQKQPDNEFKLPIAIDIYTEGKKQRFNAFIGSKQDTLKFQLSQKPNLVNFDGDKVLLAVKDDRKSAEEFAYQYLNAPHYQDRLEAIQFALKSEETEAGNKILIAALKDKYYGLRKMVIADLKLSDVKILAQTKPILLSIAENDPATAVQAEAIKALGTTGDKSLETLYNKALTSKSYAVQGAGLQSLFIINPDKAFADAKKLQADNKADLTQSIVQVYGQMGGAGEWPFVVEKFDSSTPQKQIDMLGGMSFLIANTEDENVLNQGVERIKMIGVKYKKYGLDKPMINLLQQLKQKKSTTIKDLSFMDVAVKEIEAAK